MLHCVEVWVQRRRVSRHAVDLRCDVVTEAWQEPTSHRVLDLGLGGLFVESQRFPDEGSDVLVEMRVGRFVPERLTLLGKVRRCELHGRARGRSGFAVELDALASEEADTLRDALVGRPPPLPAGRRFDGLRERLWIESLDDDDEAPEAALVGVAPRESAGAPVHRPLSG